jgi:hypothetical protein
MGIAVLSGVVESLDPSSRLQRDVQATKWESHTPGTLTPVGAPDASSPARFIACVSREESVRKLEAIFGGLGPLGASIEVVAGQNVKSAEQADVVLLWYVVDDLCSGQLNLRFPIQLQTSARAYNPGRAGYEGCIRWKTSDQHPSWCHHTSAFKSRPFFHKSHPSYAQYSMQSQ